MARVVGISQCLDERGRWRKDREYLYGDAAYARAVEDAGGSPLHLPPQADAGTLLDRIDALVLAGGDDLAPPSPYPPEVAFDLVPERQRDFDRRCLAGALERGLPVLGICYGMQLIALHFGGALHYHLPLDLPRAGPHQLPERDGRHAIAVEPGTRLAAILGPRPEPVNSLHHQGVCDPGRGLRVGARSPDGVIEAIERESGPLCVGVQWHPEKLEGEARLALFRALLSAAA